MLSDSSEGYVDVSYIIATFNNSLNMLMAKLGSVNSGTLVKLFNIYCCIKYMYGVVLCDINLVMFQNLCTQWRKAVRRVMHLNRRTHSKFLSPICGFHNIEYTVKLRVAKLFTKVYHSDNVLVGMLAKRCLYQCTSNIIILL